MNSANNVRFFVLGALLSVVSAGNLGSYPQPAPLPPPVAYGPPRIGLPAPPPVAYGPPRIELPAPAPVPVYGVPSPVVPLPAPLPPQQIISEFSYPVHTPARAIEVIAPQPIPAPIYSVPRHEIARPVLPLASSFNYEVPQYVPRVLNTYAAPAPLIRAPAPVYSAPRLDIPARPQSAYGAPLF